MDSKVFNGQLHHPSSFFIAGSSGSGKSYFVKKLVENLDFLFDSKIEKIVWCYGHYQDMFQDLGLKSVDFVQGFCMDRFRDNNGPTLVIVDDLLNELKDSNEFINMFVKNRHLNITTIFLTQNLFFKSHVYRSCSLNTNYFVIMRMLRDKKQILTLVHQMFPENPKFAKEAILDATKEPYSYILIDTQQATPEQLRLRTRLFPEDWEDGYYGQYVYIPR